jgi:hypothetical protein
MGDKIMGIVEAITQGLILLNRVLGYIETLVNLIIAKEQAAAKRLKDAEAAEEAAQKMAVDNQAKKEMANLAAFKSLVDDSWKVRLSQVLTYINANQLDKVLLLVQKIDDAEVNNILFPDPSDVVFSNEYKALKIIEIMKRSNG